MHNEWNGWDLKQPMLGEWGVFVTGQTSVVRNKICYSGTVWVYCGSLSGHWKGGKKSTIFIISRGQRRSPLRFSQSGRELQRKSKDLFPASASNGYWSLWSARAGTLFLHYHVKTSADFPLKWLQIGVSHFCIYKSASGTFWVGTRQNASVKAERLY